MAAPSPTPRALLIGFALLPSCSRGAWEPADGAADAAWCEAREAVLRGSPSLQ